LREVLPVKIVFMGTPDFALPSLTGLIQSDHTVCGVVTQPDRLRGRGKKLTPPPVKSLAVQHGIPVLQPEKVREEGCVRWLNHRAPDFIVVVAYGQILPAAVLGIPPRGCVNLHASMLPRYRGAAPISRAIISGEEATGLTTMLMNEGMDTGDILLQKEEPIAGDDDAVSLSRRLSLAGASLLLETISLLQKNLLTPRPQNDSLASSAPPLQKEDGLIDWTRSAREIHNRIRGTLPWPGAFTHLGHKRLKILKSAVSEGSDQLPPGTVARAGPEGIQVVTGRGCLTLTEVQPENRGRMKAGEFLSGHPLPAGTRLG
jgi:methionyl-tRNA formyltransferase